MSLFKKTTFSNRLRFFFSIKTLNDVFDPSLPALVQRERGERPAQLHHNIWEAGDHTGKDQRSQLQRGINLCTMQRTVHICGCYFKVNDCWLLVSVLQIKYRESWHTLRAQGYKLTMQDIPFQAAKSSTGIASDVNALQT